MSRRVAIIGRTTLAVACLDIVRAAGDHIVAVIPDASDDGRDGWQRSLRGAAERDGLAILDGTPVNHADFVASLAELQPDFLLSFQAAPILRAPLIGTARVAALNVHYGPLPRYRGVAPIAWALLNGEREHGVTLHVIEPGIDSGPIVASRAVRVEPGDTGRTLYDRCLDAGIGLFRDSWASVREQEPVVATPQDDAEALYYNRWAIDFADRRVRWTADCRAIANRIRALIFPPFQYPEFGLPDGPTLEIGTVTWDREPHRGRPGEILVLEAATIVVAAPGGRIIIGDARRDGSVLAPTELAATGLKVGAILG